jgi:hypothetical protein
MTTALQIILVYGWLRSVAPVYWMLMLAADLRRETLNINLLSLLVALAAALPIVYRWGFVGIAAEFTALEVFRNVWMAVVVRDKFGASLVAQAQQVWPGLAVSMVVGAVLALALRGPEPTAFVVLAELAAAAGLYLALLILFRQLGREQLILAGSLLQKRAG